MEQCEAVCLPSKPVFGLLLQLDARSSGSSHSIDSRVCGVDEISNWTLTALEQP